MIGRAVKKSLFWALLAAAVLGAIFWVMKRKSGAAPSQITRLTAPARATPTTSELPSVEFADVTVASGISFHHYNGAYGDKLLPETMGSGVAFFDYDGDGAPDLLFVNGTDWPWHPAAPGRKTTPVLYHNNGRGQFADVTEGSGLDAGIYGMGVATGDFDNDGRVDIFITAVGGNHLFHNLGAGKFADVTREAGVSGAVENWSTCAAWLDFDNDGLLDLFVGNYVQWSKEIDLKVGFKIDGVKRAYGQPTSFSGAFPLLYHNDGGGKFSDVSERSGVQVRNPSTGVPVAKALGVAPVDLNGDGWMDLIVANDTVQNFVFTNAGNGTFREIGALSGLAFDANGQTRGAMGIDAARYRNDGSLGIAIGNFANEMTALYVSQENPCLFTDEAIPEGVGPASRLLLKFGVLFLDYDLDGRLDLLSCDGHLDADIVKLQQSQTYAQPAQLFWNSGASSGATFIVVPPSKAGTNLFQPIVGRGSAFADIDGDGDLDLVLTQTGGAPLLLRNDQKLGRHWLRLKLAGTKSNRDAIGAWVTVRAGAVSQARQVMPTRSYLSQSELTLTFGLGTAATVDAIDIVWPGGRKQKVGPLPVDRTHRIEEGN
ncbi:MAG: enediyne biosynthesis protein [Verrucomicrobiota bacterium]